MSIAKSSAFWATFSSLFLWRIEFTQNFGTLNLALGSVVYLNHSYQGITEISDSPLEGKNRTDCIQAIAKAAFSGVVDQQVFQHQGDIYIRDLVDILSGGEDFSFRVQSSIGIALGLVAAVLTEFLLIHPFTRQVK